MICPIANRFDCGNFYNKRPSIGRSINRLQRKQEAVKPMTLISAKLRDIASHLPANVLRNDDLARIYPDWDANKIFEKTGIKERQIASIDETAGDLAYEAAIKLFNQEKVRPGEIDFIILCTQAPDYVLPATACILQHRLGISKTAGALDINLGCSGFVYALALAKGLIETGAAKGVLLLTADTYSKYIHPLDKSVRTLFGDGAAATAIMSTEQETASIGPFVFGTDGSGARNLIVETGGFRKPRTLETSIEIEDSSGNVRTQDHLYMNGAEVMAFCLKEVPNSVKNLLLTAGIDMKDVDYFVLHQANSFILEKLRKKLNIPAEKLPVLLKHTGNTVSSTIPLVLERMRLNNQLQTGHRLMLIGFGVGYSLAACMLTM